MIESFETRIVRCYQEYLAEKLISIVLFGSRARGDSKPESDYDILVIARDLPSGPVDRVMFIRKPLVGIFPEKVALLAKTPEEIDKGFPPLYLDLGVDGKILFDRDAYFEKKRLRIQELIELAGLVRKKEEGNLRWIWKKQPQRHWALDWAGFREF